MHTKRERENFLIKSTQDLLIKIVNPHPHFLEKCAFANIFLRRWSFPHVCERDLIWARAGKFIKQTFSSDFHFRFLFLSFFCILLQPPITTTPFCENAEKFFSRFSFVVAISTHNSLLHSSASQLSSSVMDFFLINGNVYPIMNGPQTFLLFPSPLFFY